MKVELIEVGRVIPYARNPSRNKKAILKVAASIKEYGFRQPIAVDEELVIIAGDTRLQAAQQLGLKKVPVHVATGLTQAQVKAYRLADNRTHEDSEWDDELLAIELSELDKLMDFWLEDKITEEEYNVKRNKMAERRDKITIEIDAHNKADDSFNDRII